MSQKRSGNGTTAGGSAIINKVSQIVESPQNIVIVGGTAMAGGVSGGTAGAGVGAAVGSLLGPPGAAVGFLIGLVVGTTGGTLTGGCAGNFVSKKVGG